MIPLQALSEEESLLKGPFPEPHRDFGNGMNARELAARHFSNLGDLLPALMDAQLYVHQCKQFKPRTNISTIWSSPRAPPVEKPSAFLIQSFSNCFGNILRALRGRLQAVDLVHVSAFGTNWQLSPLFQFLSCLDVHLEPSTTTRSGTFQGLSVAFGHLVADREDFV